MLPNALQLLITGVLLNLQHVNAQQHVLDQSPTYGSQGAMKFHLRHVHAMTNASDTILADVSIPSSILDDPDGPYSSSVLNTVSMKTHRPRWGDMNTAVTWDLEPVVGPDVRDRSTVHELAKMTNNAYSETNETDWYYLKEKWKNTPFGWEPDADGFRGHVFVSEDESTVVLTIKGTSPALIIGGGPSGKKDKLNDNLLFSCCCARVDWSWSWSTVCDCYKGGSECGWDCVEESLADKSLFYSVGMNLYNNLTYMYPDATLWITGHSLGGALASLLGVTFGVPVVAFESPGEMLAARRLHLPTPPSLQHITHFYHTADPVAMGTCTGAFSSCTLGGYALETRCHLGLSAVFDTVNELGWSVDIRAHGIGVVVEKLLNETGDWFSKPKSKNGSERHPLLPVPREEEEDCLAAECFSWDFV